MIQESLEWAGHLSLHEVAGVIVLGIGMGWAFWHYVPLVRLWLGLAVGSLFFLFTVIARLVVRGDDEVGHRVGVWMLFALFIVTTVIAIRVFRAIALWRDASALDDWKEG